MKNNTNQSIKMTALAGLASLAISAGIAITIGTLGIGGCNCNKKTPDIYQRIDNSTTISYENKQVIKNWYKNIDIKKTEKEMKINPDEIKRLNKKQRKELAIKFNKDIADANIIDPNNVSYKDIIFMYEAAQSVADGAMSQMR